MKEIINAEKAFDKIHYLFVIRTLNKLGIEIKCLNIIKSIYDKPTAYILLNNKSWKTFPPRSGKHKSAHSHNSYSL